VKEKELVSVLFKLSSAAGVSGYEDSAVNVAAGFFEQFGCVVKKDRFGNLLAYKKGTAEKNKKVALALIAHIDEVGLMVTKIEEGGFLRFTAIGGLDARTLPGQAVLIHGRKTLKGVIGAAPPHLLSDQERKKTTPVDQLFIDIGLESTAARKVVSIGDIVSFDQNPLQLVSGKKVSGKALDNRAGVAALVYCAAELKQRGHEADICFVASMQEEVGLRGATTAAFGLKPDFAVAVDVTHGDGSDLERDYVYKLGDGPAIATGPNFHDDLFIRLKTVAAENFLPHQIEPIPGRSGTDAWAFQVSGEGIPTGLLSIPLRYMHTTVELISVDDLLVAGKILSLLAQGFNHTSF
jgi:tetrahedral aminopeptidase